MRVYLTGGSAAPVEVLPPPSSRGYWSRRGIAEWLVERLSEDIPTLVGIDHGFSYPLRYFEKHGLKPDWPAFLDDYQHHWPTDTEIYVDFVRDGVAGNGPARTGDTRWRRLTEERAGSAKSVFHFDVPGSVAKSTHAGIPWLRFLRQRLGQRVHFWPFDAWMIPAGRSAIVEVYPALWSREFEREDRTGDQHDAYSVAAWLSRTDRDGSLIAALDPVLTPHERTVAQVEGWIWGVAGPAGVTIPKANRGPREPASPMARQAEKPRSAKRTTDPGYTNKNDQTVLRRTDDRGNHYNQLTYALRCNRCAHEYGANGADIWLRRCPACDGGAPGLEC